ncbi:hypothetical protein WG66_010602 [Moniliophthora roreri]|nr:hypothetical protein WG66_010602 [Moniliophthora roreri]
MDLNPEEELELPTIATQARSLQSNGLIAPHTLPPNADMQLQDSNAPANTLYEPANRDPGCDESTEGDTDDEPTSEAIEARRKAKGKARAVEVEDEEQREEQTLVSTGQLPHPYPATNVLMWDPFLESVLKHALNIIKEEMGFNFNAGHRAIWELYLRIVMNNILAGLGQIPPHHSLQFNFSALWQCKLSIMEPQVTDPQMFTVFFNENAAWVKDPARTSSIHYPADHPYMSRSRRFTMEDFYWPVSLPALADPGCQGSVQQPDEPPLLNEQEDRQQDLDTDNLPLGFMSPQHDLRTPVEDRNEPIVFGNSSAHQALTFNAPNQNTISAYDVPSPAPSSSRLPPRTLASTVPKFIDVGMSAPAAITPTIQMQLPSPAASSSTRKGLGAFCGSNSCRALNLTFVNATFDTGGTPIMRVSAPASEPTGASRYAIVLFLV